MMGGQLEVDFLYLDVLVDVLEVLYLVVVYGELEGDALLKSNMGAFIVIYDYLDF